MKLVYIYYKLRTDKYDLILSNSTVIYMDPSLKPYEAEIYTTLAHLFFLLGRNPFLFSGIVHRRHHHQEAPFPSLPRRFPLPNPQRGGCKARLFPLREVLQLSFCL